MSRRDRIAQKLVRIAELHEQRSLIAVVQAEQERAEAEAVVAEMEAAQARAERELTGGGVLDGTARELLWTVRSRARVDRQLGEQLLERSAAEVERARAEHVAKRQDLQVREKVHAHLRGQWISERAAKEQRELDELVSQRWGLATA